LLFEVFGVKSFVVLSFVILDFLGVLISEFGSLIFGVFELCCLVINDFGNICSWGAFVLWGFAFIFEVL